MIKPYNTNNKITKENSMFNELGVDYDSHSLEHQLWHYETTLILQMETPYQMRKDEGICFDEALLNIKNEMYHPENVTDVLKIINGQYEKPKPRKTMNDVFKFLYDE